MIEAALERRVHLPCYRGRSCHGFAAQAAERAVREATGVLAVSGVRVNEIAKAGEGWRAEVEVDGVVYDVDVHRELGAPTHLTCSTAEVKRPNHYVAGSPRARVS